MSPRVVNVGFQEKPDKENAEVQETRLQEKREVMGELAGRQEIQEKRHLSGRKLKIKDLSDQVYGQYSHFKG